MGYQEDLALLIEKRQEEMKDISDKVWEYAESRFVEFKSAKLQKEYLAPLGFTVTEGQGGAKTARLCWTAPFGTSYSPMYLPAAPPMSATSAGAAPPVGSTRRP